MPKNPFLKKILVIGAGPIVIGQGCEFDYSGAQACQALREEGCFVILVNSNPATIMTDPDLADATYLEPLTLHVLVKIIEKERPDALLPTMGGQTALNCTLELAQSGILSKYAVQVIGLSLQTIEYAENRMLFRQLLHEMGLPILPSAYLTDMGQLMNVVEEIGFPAIVRSSFTLGGYGGGLAYGPEELAYLCEEGLAISPSGLLIEKSIEGWKEYELEVVRDSIGNCIVVCGIENLDPMGVHTGDSITVAPIQTLTDKEFQRMRLCAFAIMEMVGMTSGGCNVQFAVDPTSGEMICIEMNPRVSRSSALVSKATGFPIAKIAAKLALGYALHELCISSVPAFFEPALDYVVVKIPFFNFNKFPQAEKYLNSSMKAVGETFAIGRSFQEALQKAIDSLDMKIQGLEKPRYEKTEDPDLYFEKKLRVPHPERLWFVGEAIRRGWTLEKIQGFTRYDPWFLKEIECLIATESIISQSNFSQIQKSELISWKKLGFCDKRLAHLLRVTEEEIWEKRSSLSIHPTYKRIDSCAAEFSTETAYLYSTFEEECEARPSSKEKIVVLGSGPNRIGQGIEFDYCCVHALQAIRELGYEAVMINCNPATVSTDCDRSDRLYIEPLCAEKVHEIIRLENPLGVIIQFGGQSPLDVGKQLYARGIDALGTSFYAIDRCEDRDKFRKLVRDLSLDQPKNTSFSEPWQAFQEAAEIGYPLLLRPSYVIGGSFIQVINNEGELEEYLKNSPSIFGPVLMEEFLEGGIEVEVDAIGDGHEIFICGVVEHLDPVGIHSGDSICSLSPLKLGTQIQAELKKQTVKIGLSLGIIGLFNVQFCVVDQQTVFVLEVNPRASRTIPLLSKVTGIPFVRVATRCILGRSLKMQGYEGEAIPHFFGVKVPVFPFNRMRVFEKNLGPTMLSTGEVLGIGKSYREAFAKAAVSIDPSLALSSAVQDEVAALLPAGDYVIYQLGKGSF